MEGHVQPLIGGADAGALQHRFGQHGDQVLVVRPQMVLDGVGHDQVVGGEGIPRKAVPLVHRGKGDDGGGRTLRLRDAHRAENRVVDTGVEEKGGGDDGRCLWLLRREVVHIHPQGHQLGDILPLRRYIGESGQSGQTGDFLGAGGLLPGKKGAAQYTQGQGPGPDLGQRNPGQGFQSQGQCGAQSGQIEQQMLLPMGLYPGEQEQAEHWLHQGEQGEIPGFAPPEQRPNEGSQGQHQDNPAEIAAQHHRVHPAALVVGGVGVQVVVTQHLVHQEALAEEEGAHRAGAEQGNKRFPLIPPHGQGEQGCQAEGHGEKEKVPPQQEHQGEQGAGEDTPGPLGAAFVGVDHKGPDARPGRRHIHKAGESGVEQHGGSAGQQGAAAAHPPPQGQHARQGRENIQVGNGEVVDISPGAQEAHDQRNRPGEPGGAGPGPEAVQPAGCWSSSRWRCPSSKWWRCPHCTGR